VGLLMPALDRLAGSPSPDLPRTAAR
jgi:hypothetical protein